MVKQSTIIILSIIILTSIFGYIMYDLNQQLAATNQELDAVKQELNTVKQDYATKIQVPEIIFDKIDKCQKIKVYESGWDFDSDIVYARDVCQLAGKDCFSATMIAMESGDDSTHAFGKGNYGCSMALSLSSLKENIENYEVVCC